MWLPMKNVCTSTVSEKKQNEERTEEHVKLMRPSNKTLTFLKLFARNYQVEKSLPEGLQEMVLG